MLPHDGSSTAWWPVLEVPTAEQWAGLRQARPLSDDVLALTPVQIDGSSTGVSLGIDARGWLHLLIPAAIQEATERLADLNCLRVRYKTIEGGVVIALSAPPSHERVFTPFCREIIEAVVVQKRDASRALAATVRAWQSAWKPVRQDMDKTTQVGLFGELVVLRYLLIPARGTSAVGCWSGPDFERHDFVLDHLDIEVKTTRKSRAEHEISRMDQLHVPAGKELLFVSIQLEETIGGTETLATLVDVIVDLLRGDSFALDTFMTKMVTLGWGDELRTSGELVRFNVRRTGIYAVDAAFPRLPETFSAPSGVVAIKYVVDLANLPTLDMDEALDRVRR
jgi:hypothetical protein